MLYCNDDIDRVNLCYVCASETMGFCSSWAISSVTIGSLNTTAPCLTGLKFAGFSAGIGLCATVSIGVFQNIANQYRNHTPLARAVLDLGSPPVPPITMSRD